MDVHMVELLAVITVCCAPLARAVSSPGSPGDGVLPVTDPRDYLRGSPGLDTPGLAAAGKTRPQRSINDVASEDGIKLNFPATHLIVAPRRVRPGSVVSVYVSFFTLFFPYVDVKAWIRSGEKEYATTSERFHANSARLIYMQLPVALDPGNYSLVVQGDAPHSTQGHFFRNETEIEVYRKQASVFIQCDKYLYKSRQWVSFRVIAVRPNLLPLHTASMNIYVKDAMGSIVRRWIQQQLFMGFYENKFWQDFPVKFGVWTIEVHMLGWLYKENFKVENWFGTRFDVNVTMPPYIKDNEYAVAGTIVGNYTNHTPVKGNATIVLELIPPAPSDERRKKRYPDYVKPPSEGHPNPTIRETVPFFEGVAAFSFPLAKLREFTDKLEGHEVRVWASVYDWFYMEEKSNWAHAQILYSGMRIKFLGGEIRTFKPGQRLDVYVAVQGYDGDILRYVNGRQLRIDVVVTTETGNTYTPHDSPLLIPDDSIVHYSYTPRTTDRFIRIRATFEGKGVASAEMTAYKHYTKENQFISVTSSTIEPRMDQYMVYTVRVSTYVEEVHYQLISSGTIQTAGTLYMTSTQKTFSLALSRDAVPNARMLVFCLLPSGEILADNLSFFVKGTQTNRIKLRENRGQDFSGDSLELEFDTEPSVLVGVSGSPLDLYSQGVFHHFNEHDVEKELMTYDSHANTSFIHTWRDPDSYFRSVYYSAPSYAVDANTTFTFSGLIVFTDASLTRIPAYYDCNETRGYLPCFDGSCFLLEQQCDGVRQCLDGADEMGCSDSNDLSHLKSPFDMGGRIQFQFDSSQWLWKSTYTQPNGQIDMHVQIPFRPHIWVVQGFSISADYGLSFIKEPMRIETTRSFYINLEAPSSAFKGEQLGLQVGVFNYNSEADEALIMLHDSDDFRFIHVEDFGRASSYSPRTSRGDFQTMVSLQAGETTMIHFPILPVKTGTISVRVTGTVLSASVSTTKTIKITYDGVTNHYHTPYLLDLINSGSIMPPDLDVPVPERFVVPGQRWHLYVPGSPLSTVTVSGGVVGPEPGDDKGLWATLLKSSGQGESYIFDFAIDLYWLRFLKASDQLSAKKRQTIIGYMNKDLTVVYSYMRSYGCFVMFRPANPTNYCSLWISAMGLEVLSDSMETEWEQDLFIDVKIVNRVALWVTSQQNVTSGAFSEVGIWFDRKMLDPVNLTNAEGVSYNLSLTAYVTIALAKAKLRVSGEAAAAVQESMSLASDYLAQHLPLVTDPFQLTIITYALFMTGHRLKDGAFFLMNQARRETEFVYWSAEPIPPNPVDIIDTIHYLGPRQDQPHEARAVQATGYALMVYIMNNRYREGISIMKWLQTQRNTDGGFASSQDTLVALQALSAFANADTNRALYNIGLDIQLTSTPNVSFYALLNKDTFGEHHSYNLPSDRTYGSVRSRAQGTGYALIQLHTTVNVEYPRLVRKPVTPAFELDIESLSFTGRNASIMNMLLCTKWLRTDLAPRSGFVMIEVDVPTGFKVNKQTLRDAERAMQPHIWKRSRATRQKVYMHVDYIPAERTCFGFHGNRMFPVANGTIQHKIRVYELYEPGNHNTTLYTTYDLHHNHICQVCGSFQCPYCPHYNSASQRRAHYTIYTLNIIVIVLLVKFNIKNLVMSLL